MEECLICFTLDGKSDREITEDIFMNRKTHNYPMIPLSKAYECKCSNTFAHSKCLLGINKCPTCRKFISKPNLYVETKYDYIFGFLFRRIKAYPRLIVILKNFSGIIIIFSFGLFFACDKEIIVIQKNIKFAVSMALLLSIQLLAGFVFFMEDYFKKYWLYDAKTLKINSL